MTVESVEPGELVRWRFGRSSYLATVVSVSDHFVVIRLGEPARSGPWRFPTGHIRMTSLKALTKELLR